MAEIALKCSCSKVQGLASNVTASSGSRFVCYCDDCQAFARFLGKEDVILDAYGGTDIFQMTPSQLKITEGSEHIRCMRLSDKGMYRWYTACCKTPIGNTMSAKVPFIGMIHNFMHDDGMLDKNLGPVRGYGLTKFAKETLPAEHKQTGFPWRIILRFIYKLSIWKLTGKGKPTPFFDSNGNPISRPHVLGTTTES